MKRKSPLALLLLAAISMSMFLSCDKPHDDPYAHDSVNWKGSNSGTLELINGSNKDMVLFVGQTPAPSNLLGGVMAGATVKHDISSHVSDFSVGGYAVLRGVSKEEYDKYALEPSKAKIEFTAMVTYGAGKEYRYNIDKNYIGDNAFKVNNTGKIGIELRKNSPDGEKVAYLPALQTNQMVYSETDKGMTLFPVYVFFNKKTGEVSTLKSSTMFDAVTVAPRPLSPPNNSNIQNYYFPNDETLTWEYIVGTLKQSAAYITVINNITNQAGYVTNAVSKQLVSQSGYDVIGSGEKLTYEIESTDEGMEIGLTAVFYGGKIKIPITFEGENTQPLIKNGYNYSVSISYIGGQGGDIQNPANYKAKLTGGEEKDKRDLSDQIESL